MEMVKVQLIGLCNMGNKLDAVIHFNNNESVVSFNVDELSREAQDSILAILNGHLEGLGITELTNKLVEA